MVGFMTTFSRTRARTFLSGSIRATPHGRGVRPNPQFAGEAAVKCMVFGYHVKWRPALLGSCTACFGIRLCLKHQDTHPVPRVLGHLDVFYRASISSFTLCPTSSQSLTELKNRPPYPGCYPHVVTVTVFRHLLLSHLLFL